MTEQPQHRIGLAKSQTGWTVPAGTDPVEFVREIQVTFGSDMASFPRVPVIGDVETADDGSLLVLESSLG